MAALLQVLGYFDIYSHGFMRWFLEAFIWFYTFHVVLEELCRMPGLQTSLFKTATQKCFAEFCVVFDVFFQAICCFLGTPFSKNTRQQKGFFLCPKNETCSFNIHLWRVLFYLFKKRWTWPGCVIDGGCTLEKLQVLQVPGAVWRLVTIENFSGKKNCFPRLL